MPSVPKISFNSQNRVNLKNNTSASSSTVCSNKPVAFGAKLNPAQKTLLDSIMTGLKSIKESNTSLFGKLKCGSMEIHREGEKFSLSGLHTKDRSLVYGEYNDRLNELTINIRNVYGGGYQAQIQASGEYAALSRPGFHLQYSPISEIPEDKLTIALESLQVPKI